MSPRKKKEAGASAPASEKKTDHVRVSNEKKQSAFRVEGHEPTAAETVAMDLAIRQNLATPRAPGDGIGTLGEKRMHAILKDFICRTESGSDAARQEVRLDALYPDLCGGRSKPVADVLCGDGIFEIQTGGFFPLRDKIGRYLEHTPCRITVIHPIAAVRYTHWIDPVTGDISPKRRSPKRGDAREVLRELYWLRDYLGDPRFTLRLLFLEIEEFRLQNGWSNDGKRGATRYERIPLKLVSELSFDSPDDYAVFLPPDGLLPAPFTAAEFGRATGLRGKTLYGTLKILCSLGLLVQDGFRGRSMTFRETQGGLFHEKKSPLTPKKQQEKN